MHNISLLVGLEDRVIVCKYAKAQLEAVEETTIGDYDTILYKIDLDKNPIDELHRKYSNSWIVAKYSPKSCLIVSDPTESIINSIKFELSEMSGKKKYNVINSKAEAITKLLNEHSIAIGNKYIPRTLKTGNYHCICASDFYDIYLSQRSLLGYPDMISQNTMFDCLTKSGFTWYKETAKDKLTYYYSEDYLQNVLRADDTSE